MFKAPCVFFVQNNQWAISVPVSRQQAGPSIAHRAIGYGMPGIRVDGNDVLACYAVMAEAAERARERRRPDADRGGHLPDGPAHHLRRPDPVPVAGRSRQRGRARDPIPRYRTYLQSIGVWTERLEQRVATRSARLRAELRDAMVNTPDIDVAEMFDTVYADITPNLAAQRDQLAAELAKEA